MLRSLRIRQLVLVDDLTLDFGHGLALLTGETGAGKSILIGAVGLVTGNRADRAMVRKGADRARVEAEFHVDADSSAARWTLDQGLDDGDDGEQIIVRREVPVEGASRVWINGSPTTVAQLRELGARLLEVHGQHETQVLFDPEVHRELVDRFGELEPLVDEVRSRYEAVVEAQQALCHWIEQAASREARIEELTVAIREIDAVAPESGEAVQLDLERRRLQNASRLTELLDRVVAATVDSEPSAATLASAATRAADELAELDPQLVEAGERLRSVAIDVEDLGALYRDYRASLRFEPGRVDEIEARRSALRDLFLRYGENEEAVLAWRERAAEELGGLEDADHRIAAARERLAACVAGYEKVARKLGKARAKAGKAIAPAVEEQLTELAMPKARFRAQPQPSSAQPAEGGTLPLHPKGAERVEFLLAANPGEPFRELGRVASGGELSRVMLALHAVFERAGAERVLVFDEVDTGVGGAVADAVGARLAGLARRNQVLCVTHLPQVAAYADRHYRVVKHESGGRTRVEVVELPRADRVEELARMLAGRVPTEASRQHATELLGAAARPESRRRA